MGGTQRRACNAGASQHWLPLPTGTQALNPAHRLAQVQPHTTHRVWLPKASCGDAETDPGQECGMLKGATSAELGTLERRCGIHMHRQGDATPAQPRCQGMRA